jgi:hypothetical protein
VLLAVTVAFFSHAARIAAVHCALIVEGHCAVAGQTVVAPLGSFVALAEVAEAADLAVSHASTAEAVHVQARSAIVSSRSDFMKQPPGR